MTATSLSLRDVLKLPLTPEVDGMIRIWVDAESEKADGPAEAGKAKDGPQGTPPAPDGSASALRRQVVNHLLTIPSANVYDGLAKLSVWRSATASGLNDGLVEELAGTAVEELVALARTCATTKRYRAD